MYFKINYGSSMYLFRETSKNIFQSVTIRFKIKYVKKKIITSENCIPLNHW